MKYIISLIILLIAILFYHLPELDLKVSKVFYNGERFFLAKTWYLKFINDGIIIIIDAFLIVFFAINLINNIFNKNIFNLHLSYKKITYLLICLLIGPGLIVNSLLKEHSGRARPSHTIEFNGEKQFTKAFDFSGSCQDNCSFVSGHAAYGFYLTAFAFVYIRYFATIFSSGLILGLILSFGRIAKGAHFLSDVFISGVIVIYVNHILYKIFFRQHK